MKNCKYCDGAPGSVETYAGQVKMPINGRVRLIDGCIQGIVAALNAGGVLTEASCCGHGRGDGSIVLGDGRELVIRKCLKDSANNVIPLKSFPRDASDKLDIAITRVLVLHDSASFKDTELEKAANELEQIHREFFSNS